MGDIDPVFPADGSLKTAAKMGDVDATTSTDDGTETFNRDALGRFATSRSPSREVSDDDDTASRTSEEDDYAIVFDSIEESLGGVALALSSESFGQPGELKEAIDALAAVRRGN